MFSYKDYKEHPTPMVHPPAFSWIYKTSGEFCHTPFSVMNVFPYICSFYPEKDKTKKQKVAQLKTENTSYSSLHLMFIKVSALLSFVLICATAVSPSWKVHIWAFLLQSYMLKGYIYGKQILFFPSPSPRSLPKLISYLFYVLKVNFV